MKKIERELLKAFKEYKDEVKGRQVKSDKDLCLRWGANSKNISKPKLVDCPYLDRRKLLCKYYKVLIGLRGFVYGMGIRYKGCRLPLSKRRVINQ